MLFEDLRLELMAISAGSIPQLDALDPYIRESKDVGRTRKLYFFRRTLGTLTEFAETLGWIDLCAEMIHLRQSWDAQENRDRWVQAVAFFREKERIIKLIRNDIGGHFGQQAADYAISNLDPNATGRVELRIGENGKAEMYFHFVGEIAAKPLTRHLPGTSDEEKLRRLFDETLHPAHDHATFAVKMIAESHLWPRFGQ